MFGDHIYKRQKAQALVKNKFRFEPFSINFFIHFNPPLGMFTMYLLKFLRFCCRLHSVFSRILRTAILPICISTHDAPDQDYPLRRTTASHHLLLQVLLHTYKLLIRPTGNNLKYPHVIFQSYPGMSNKTIGSCSVFTL